MKLLIQFSLLMEDDNCSTINISSPCLISIEPETYEIIMAAVTVHLAASKSRLILYWI